MRPGVTARLPPPAVSQSRQIDFDQLTQLGQHAFEVLRGGVILFACVCVGRDVDIRCALTE